LRFAGPKINEIKDENVKLKRKIERQRKEQTLVLQK